MTLLLYTQNIKRQVLKKKQVPEGPNTSKIRLYVSLRDLRRGAAVSSFSSSSFSTLSPLLPAPSVSVALGFFASTAGFTGACNKQMFWVELLFIFRMKRAVIHWEELTAGFLPPNRILKSTVAKTTTTETKMPIVMLGCFSPFSITS